MQNLRQFLDLLRREGELVEVDAPVSPDLELAEIHRRVLASGGPALLFTQVEGADFPCVTNLFGTPRRVDLAFGPRPEQFIRELVGLAQDLPALSAGKLWQRRSLLGQALRVGIKTVSSGPILEAQQSPPRLDRLPLLKTWPEDGGFFVTLPLVYTEHPDTGHHNLGMYRIQRHDAQTTGVHWQIQKGGGFHYHVAQERNQALPLTLFVGGPPALILAAIAPLPEDLPELILASLLQGGKLRRVANPTGHHPLIAEAEFAIQGVVPPHLRRPEGPFGDHYGYYSLQHDYPVLQVSHIYHRRDAIFPATVVGKPPQEDFFLGNYIQRLMAPLSRLVMPAIKAIWSYGETGYHCLSCIVVQERYPREAMKFAFRILGEDGGQLALTKFLLVIDQPLDLADFRQVLEHLLTRVRFETDFFLIANLAMDTLDYTGPATNKGSKGILVGVGPAIRELPRTFAGPLPAGAREALPYCAGCLVVSGPAYETDPAYAQQLAQDRALADWPLVFLVDQARIAQHSARFLWATFTRFEPAGDTYAADTQIRRHHLCFTPPIVFDCRMKPGYPAELVTDEATSKKVTRRWQEYFPKGNVEGVEDPLGNTGFGLLKT
ncbi:MAG: UbiD family decarboxylase [Candidatus Latescibacteria bacterium]|nr:UbiD family decarboxylase [Candidatus Latescibacterota bacterium]